MREVKCYKVPSFCRLFFTSFLRSRVAILRPSENVLGLSFAKAPQTAESARAAKLLVHAPTSVGSNPR